LTVIVLPIAWLLSGLVGLGLPEGPQPEWLSVLSFMILGVLLAADLALAPASVAAIAGAYGALHGLLNGAALAAVGAGPLSLAGVAATVAVVALLASAAVVPLKASWARIVVRVLGSWVAAVGLLMLGWIAKGTG
jgi:urease accessory protein